MPISPETQRRTVMAAFLAACLGLSLAVMLFFSMGSRFGSNGTPFGEEALPPVAYRVLVPALEKAVNGLFSEETKLAMTPALTRIRDSYTAQRLLEYTGHRDRGAIRYQYIADTAIRLGVVYGTLLAFIAMFYRLAAALFPDSRAYPQAATLLMLTLLGPLTAQYGYTYDYAELFFNCLLFYLTYQRRWGAYLLCLAVALLNKETAIFNVIFFMLWCPGRMPAGQYWRLAAAQVGLCLLAKFALQWYFSGLPTRYPDGAYVLRWPDSLVYYYDYGLSSVAGLFVALAACTHGWPRKPEILRRWCWLVPLNVAICLLICNPGEYRNYYPVLPPLVLMAAHTLVRLSGIARTPAFANKR